MKRAAMVVAVLAVLGICAWSFGQSNGKPAGQTPPAGQAAATGSGCAAGQAPSRRPRRKPEFEAYNDGDSSDRSGGAGKSGRRLCREISRTASCGDRCTRWPWSRYQGNNADKMMEMGKKVLAIDPDDPEALVRSGAGDGGKDARHGPGQGSEAWPKLRRTRSARW